MAIYRDGKRLEGEEAEKAMERHQARMSGGGGSSRDKSSPKARNGGGSGGKGGGRPDISPDKVSESKYNTDNSYGYYDASGKYVPAFVDMRDGGGKNQSGNYFVGGGILSGLLNAAKVRPAGGAREMQDGEYVVPIADIGYRDIRDMFDRGGPQASGGRFQGGGQLSGLANLGYSLTGREFGERTPYGSSVPTAAPAPTGGSVGGGSPTVTPNQVPTSAIMPILDANQAGYEQAAFPSPSPQSVPDPIMAGHNLPPTPTYSGRGMVNMPYPSWVKTQEQRDTVDYLRSRGVTTY